MKYEMSMINNDQQRLYSMSGNSYYKPLELVEGSELVPFVGTLVRKRTVFLLQAQEVQSKRLNLPLLLGIK